MNFFSVNGITAGYGGKNVIENISFKIEPGSLTGIIGANGSGKSTLLKAMCGILPHKGNCELNGVVLEHQSARQIAKLSSYIPQRSGITIDISTLDVVLMGYNPHLGLLEYPTASMKAAALKTLEQVGLAGKEQINYLHLSEGQKQLCILARTLVTDSKLLLLDEPESALDFAHRYRMLELLQKWVSEKDRSAVVALHDPFLALNYCDQLLLLSKGEVQGTVCPRIDSMDRMESMLSKVYGAVTLQRCSMKNGQTQLVMLKEDP